MAKELKVKVTIEGLPPDPALLPDMKVQWKREAIVTLVEGDKLQVLVKNATETLILKVDELSLLKGGLE